MINDKQVVMHRWHNVHRDQSNTNPNRSGSAPPSMEGSYAAIDNVVDKWSLPSSSLAGFNGDAENFHSADPQADPLYSTYGHLDTDVLPRLPPSTMSRESFQLVCQVGVSGDNPRLPSFNGRSGLSMYGHRSSLAIDEDKTEDDRSVKGTSDGNERTSESVLVQNALSFGGCDQSSLNLIQEDFVCKQPGLDQNCHSNHETEPFNHDVLELSLDSLSLNASNSPKTKSSVGSGCQSCQSGTYPGLTTAKNLMKTPAPIQSGIDSPSGSLSSPNEELTNEVAYFTSDFVSTGITGSDATISLNKVEDKQEVMFDGGNELHLQNIYPQHVATCGSQLQETVQRANNQTAPQDCVKLTSIEMQPPMIHAPRLPHPLYASTTAYMDPRNSFYANFSSSNPYNPQYSGYTMSPSFLAPNMAGYRPHTDVPLHFNANPGQSFSGQHSGVTYEESVSRGPVMQNLNNFYSHHGLTMHPSFPDPPSLQYLHVQDSHGDQKFQLPPSRNVSSPSLGNMRIPNSGFFSSPMGLGFVPQFPASPVQSPVYPESPVGCATSLRRQYDLGFSNCSARNVNDGARWQGQKGALSTSDYRKHSVSEELKAISGRRVELSDIEGRIFEFSIDQHGSRFIQQNLEYCSVEEKELVYEEILPHASKLITDVFGNYVIQKFFEYGTYEQRKALAGQLSGKMLPLSLQMYGCRVIQKALEVIEVDQKTELVIELDGHVMRCVQDQNGNHVIQKCIECIPTENIDFILSAFQDQVAAISSHPYGCRVIQRILEHCSDDLQCRSIVVDEILESAYKLAQDQYGNYVTQHVLEKGKPNERSQIIHKLSGKIVQLSQHKYASNVVEKCLEFGNASERECLIEEIIVQSEDNDNLLAMMKDQFANYVVQKILEIGNNKQKEILVDRIRLHQMALRKYTYGKHIVARFEELTAQDYGTTLP